MGVKVGGRGSLSLVRGRRFRVGGYSFYIFIFSSFGFFVVVFWVSGSYV